VVPYPYVGRACGALPLCMTSLWELGKAISNSSYKPRFIVAFMLTMYIKPSKVKCLLHLTNSKAALNNWKSDHFCVIKGKLLKWSRITCKSFID